jgi:putative nucleotidyltransferase with HDIG domain
MSDPVRFLNATAQALAKLHLYGEKHPARQLAIDAAYRELFDLQGHDPRPQFTFLGDEVLYGDRRLKELAGWDWAMRFAGVGIQRLQFDEHVSRDDFEMFLEDAMALLGRTKPDTSEARQMRPSSIRFGTVGLRGESETEDEPLETATISYSLGDEAEAIRWLHEEIASDQRLPLVEAEAIVRSLAVAMHGDRQVVVPLLNLKSFDQYTTTHSMNVSVLSMALAEFLGLGATDVRAFGIAGLLHDLGKVRIPPEVLTKRGKLTDDERMLMNSHPAEGARIILESEEQLDVAAVVAYEHHIMLNGGGYPTFRFRRDCHRASRLVHVCDVYDALRTRRPYREAWPMPRVIVYLEERAGLEFDPEIVHPFVAMMRQWEPVVAVDEADAVPGTVGDPEYGGEAPAPAPADDTALS